ncbi:MAG: ABC transporter permease [Nocardioidaceae bacterium]|nr:ABC transporter permease [Nocardioidaceae bacterium]MCL2614548.1 ABC transporter permease [Nocardioidaceae bacterium]
MSWPIRALRATVVALAAPLAAVLIAVIATSLVIMISGSDSGVGDFWRVMLSKPEDQTMVDIVNTAAQLYIAAVAAAIGFRMGLFNIGVEGQYGLAAYVAAVFAGGMFLPGPLNVIVATLLAVLTGAAWAGIAALLKVYRGVSEVISTLMLNAISPIIVTHFLNKYGRQTGYDIHTHPVSGSSTVGGWAPWGQDNGEIWSLGLLAVVVGVGFWLLLNRTRIGFELRATGSSPAAAAASGVSAKRMAIVAMLLSGGVAGLVWMPALFGDAYTYSESTFVGNLGFTGLAVALLGRNRAVGMAFGAVLFAWLSAQSDALQIGTDIAPQIYEITQGICVLAVVVAYEMVQRYRARAEQRAVAAAVPEAVSA